MPAAGRSDAGTRPPEQHGILLIEDDDDVGGEIIADLQGRGYRLTRAETGPDGLQAARDRSISLVIADRMLPGLDGLTLIATLRAEGIQVPVLVLSALGSVDDRIRGLRAGGDDYLTKPFAMEELAARVDALLRRPVETREVGAAHRAAGDGPDRSDRASRRPRPGSAATGGSSCSNT